MKTPTRLLAFSLFITSITCLTACEPEPDDKIETAVQSETSAPTLTQLWMLNTGLDRPESVIYDASRDVLYITNIVGDGAAMDQNGYIAKVSTAGEMIHQEWVGNLNAPKGIALAGDKLWASDINALVEIDAATGTVLARHEVDDDAYLNDVTTHPDGSVYVTDSRFSKIYRYVDGQLSLWLEHDAIKNPNGIHVIGDELVVVAGDGSTENPGQARFFQAISIRDKTVRALTGAQPDGALDAVEPDGKGGIFTTDWAGGRLMYFKEGEGTTLLKQLGQGAADVDYIAESQLLYVPVMQEGQLIAYRVE